MDTKDFGVECIREILAEGIHLSCLIGLGAGSVGGPFLVPVGEWAISHFYRVHLLGGEEDLIYWNKVGFKVVFEGIPCAKVGG